MATDASETDSQKIIGFYNKYLNFPADSNDSKAWLDKMRTDGWSLYDIESRFANYPEYTSKATPQDLAATRSRLYGDWTKQYGSLASGDGSGVATGDPLLQTINYWSQKGPQSAWWDQGGAQSLAFKGGQAVVDQMRSYNKQLGNPLTDAELVAGLNQFSQDQYKEYNGGYAADSDPFNIGRWAVADALSAKGMGDAGSALIKATDARQGVTSAQAKAIGDQITAKNTEMQNIAKVTGYQGGGNFGAGVMSDPFGDFMLSAAPLAMSIIGGPVAGALVGGARAAGTDGNILGGALMGGGLGLLGGGDLAGGTAAGNWLTSGNIGTIADVGSGVGSINPSLAGSVDSMWAAAPNPGTIASAAGTAGGNVGILDDLTSAWSNAFGEGGGSTLEGLELGGADVGAAVGNTAGYGQSMATAAELAQMQAQYPDWYNQLTGITQGGPIPSGALNIAKQLISSGATPSVLSAALSGVGGLLSGNAAQNAAQTTANAQLEAARIAAEAAKFKPIGITTRFGQSQFQKDAQGNVIGAGYQLTPEMKAQQDALMGMSGNMLTQYQNAPAQFAPMGDAGQRAMSLGNQYLATDPAAQAQKYMNEQQALLATGRERDMNQMLTGEFNRGTYGLGVGATSTGMGAANPRLEAMLNAQRQQDLGLAAQATQGGMDYAKFGAGMVGTGGDLTRGMFSGQTAAYQPYQTALQGAQYIEGLGQQPLTMGIDIGKQTSNAASGGLLAQGMVNAAQTQQNAAYSPWGTLLMGAGNQVQNYQNQQQQQQQQQQFIDAMKTWRNP